MTSKFVHVPKEERPMGSGLVKKVTATFHQLRTILGEPDLKPSEDHKVQARFAGRLKGRKNAFVILWDYKEDVPPQQVTTWSAWSSRPGLLSMLEDEIRMISPQPSEQQVPGTAVLMELRWDPDRDDREESHGADFIARHGPWVFRAYLELGMFGGDPADVHRITVEDAASGRILAEWGLTQLRERPGAVR